MQNLRKIIYELEHGVELGKLREKMVRNKLQEQLMDEKNIEALVDRLGISEIRRQQESLVKMIGELKAAKGETRESD